MYELLKRYIRIARQQLCITAAMTLALLCISLAGVQLPALAVDQPANLSDLSDKSLEDLLSTEVTSVSKRPQKLSDSATAIYVITHDDIRRSGMDGIPDLLRMVPGLQVGQINSSDWSVGSRGFSGLFSDKLLVLIDGRSVYNPLFSGVWWRAQDTLLNDIDRIEVIRGPGATLWGANAVNGVINIVTKDAGQTQGGLANIGGAGSSQISQENIRYGGQLSNGINYRFYTKTFQQDDSYGPQGNLTLANYDQQQSGARFDWDKSDNTTLTLQGDVFRSRGVDTTHSGSNLLFRSNTIHSNSDQSTLQVYYEHTYMGSKLFATESRDTCDIDFQQSDSRIPDHQIIWGLGYRQTTGYFENGPVLIFGQQKRTDRVVNLFAQDDITIKPDRLHLTLGSKFEHNCYTGYEIQPNIRMLWTPSQDKTVWAAVSRAVRTPSTADYIGTYQVQHFTGPGGVEMAPVISGSDSFKSEVVIAHELGYRIQLSNGLCLDSAAFYNVYSDLRSYEPDAPQFVPGPHPYMTLPSHVGNKLAGTSRGLELAADWNVTNRWKLAAACSWIDVSLDRSASQDATTTGFENRDPAMQFSLRSYWTLPGGLEVDAMLFHVGGCVSPSAVGSGTVIPAYNRLDLRLGKQIANDYTMSIGVRNALNGGHTEVGSVYSEPSEIERCVFCKIAREF